MSLRDQLVAKGLASKKDAKRVNRELKEERRALQGNRKSKAELQAEEEARRAEAERARLEQLKAERAEQQQARSALEQKLRVRNLLTDNKQRPGSGQPFWHRSLQGNELLRLDVSSGTAFQLRCGQAGIAALERPSWVEYVIIPVRAALRLREISPAHLVFFVDDPAGISLPENRFLERKWETSLSARRASQEDLERMMPVRRAPASAPLTAR